MIGPTSSRAPSSAAFDRRQSFAQMALDVFDHDDGVIDHQTDREHDREQGEQVDGETENLHEKDRADERDRNRDDRDDDRAPRAEEKEDDDHDDEQRLDQRVEDVVDRGVDVGGAVVGDAALHAGRQFLLDLLHLGANALDHVDRVRVRQNEDAHENRALAGETNLGVVILRAENNVGDVAQPNEVPFSCRTTRFLKSSAVCRSVFAVRFDLHAARPWCCRARRG